MSEWDERHPPSKQQLVATKSEKNMKNEFLINAIKELWLDVVYCKYIRVQFPSLQDLFINYGKSYHQYAARSPQWSRGERTARSDFEFHFIIMYIQPTYISILFEIHINKM